MAKIGKVKSSKKTNAEVKEITDADFEPLLKDNVVVLVDLFAEWCMPCVMMVPVMEELAKFFAGKVFFAKIDVNENKKTASQFKVMSLPTLLVFKNGNLAGRITGASSYEMLKEKISAYISK